MHYAGVGSLEGLMKNRLPAMNWLAKILEETSAVSFILQRRDSLPIVQPFSGIC